MKGRTRGWAGALLERLADVIVAILGIVAFAPLFFVLAVLVFWDDGRPVFFRQTRVGRNATAFDIWKFRTMRTGVSGPAITANGDHRVTRIGAWLRAFKLDELPQLFNVLTGDMSLIGPRPEVPEYVELDSPMWRAVLQVKPGITDLATLIHRNEEQMLGDFQNSDGVYRELVLPEKLQLNLAYLRSRSFLSDLRLVVMTVRYSFFPGAFDPNRVCSMFDVEVGLK